MKHFLFRIFLFYTPLIVIAIGCEIFVRTMPSSYMQKRDQLIANADSIEILALGSSHAMDGIDPNQFTLYTHNLAFGAQSIYFDRKLAEKYLPDLPRLKYVLLDFDFNSLYFDHDEGRDFFYKYYYDLDYKNRKFYKESFLQFFFVYNPGETLSLIINSIKNINKPQSGLFRGWNNKSGRNDIKVMSVEANKLRAKGFNNTAKDWDGGDSVIVDLEALINLLQSHKITPILVAYPSYSLMKSYLDSSIIERNRIIANELSEKYQILYLDFFNDDSFTVEDFFNCDHLNGAGAAKLSKKINTVIMNMESKEL